MNEAHLLWRNFPIHSLTKVFNKGCRFLVFSMKFIELDDLFCIFQLQHRILSCFLTYLKLIIILKIVMFIETVIWRWAVKFVFFQVSFVLKVVNIAHIHQEQFQPYICGSVFVQILDVKGLQELRTRECSDRILLPFKRLSEEGETLLPLRLPSVIHDDIDASLCIQNTREVKLATAFPKPAQILVTATPLCLPHFLMPRIITIRMISIQKLTDHFQSYQSVQILAHSLINLIKVHTNFNIPALRYHVPNIRRVQLTDPSYTLSLKEFQLLFRFRPLIVLRFVSVVVEIHSFLDEIGAFGTV